MFWKKEVRSALGAGLTLIAMLGDSARAQIIPDVDAGAGAGAAPVAEAACPDPRLSSGVLSDWLGSATVRASLERLLERAQWGLSSTEAAAWVVPECRGVALREWIFSGAYESASWNGPRPAGALAIVHTHPLRTDPRPSSGDAALSRRLGLPVYTLTRHGLWVAQPDGTIRLEAPAPATCTRIACVPWRTGTPHPAESAETGASNPAL